MVFDTGRFVDYAPAGSPPAIGLERGSGWVDTKGPDGVAVGCFTVFSSLVSAKKRERTQRRQWGTTEMSR